MGSPAPTFRVATSGDLVAIEVKGRRLFIDKAKRREAAALGVQIDEGYISSIETIRLPTRLSEHRASEFQGLRVSGVAEFRSMP